MTTPTTGSLPAFDRTANCFTAMRLGFALLVVAGHSWELGGHGPDPARRTLGVTLGEIGVNSFFALSGVLVTQSWLRSRSAGSFFLKRALRIFPGFWVCLLLTSLVAMPLLAAHLNGGTWAEQLSQGNYIGYLLRNCLLRVRQAGMDGLFAENPAVGAVNGSLWSLFPEALCYVGVALTATLGARWGGKARALVIGFIGLYLLHVLSLALPRDVLPPELQGKFWFVGRICTQAVFFFGGALVCLNVGWLNRRSLGAATWLLVGASVVGGYAWVSPVLLPWVLAGAGTQCSASGIERAGDFSYGIYLYHYPIQQTLVALHLNQHGPGGLFLTSGLAALILAAFSWFLVERPALAWKSKATANFNPGERR
jgi:peptidoglycan/LPS O-acetylase OafA/YrhL